MKKSILILSVLLVSFALVGCGTETSNTIELVPEPTPTPERWEQSRFPDEETYLAMGWPLDSHLPSYSTLTQWNVTSYQDWLDTAEERRIAQERAQQEQERRRLEEARASFARRRIRYEEELRERYRAHSHNPQIETRIQALLDQFDSWYCPDTREQREQAEQGRQQEQQMTAQEIVDYITNFSGEDFQNQLNDIRARW